MLGMRGGGRFRRGEVSLSGLGDGVVSRLMMKGWEKGMKM